MAKEIQNNMKLLLSFCVSVSNLSCMFVYFKITVHCFVVVKVIIFKVIHVFLTVKRL